MRCLLRINSNFYKGANLREYGEVQANLLATKFLVANQFCKVSHICERFCS